MAGSIEAIYVAPSASEAQRSVNRVELVAGAGIMGAIATTTGNPPRAGAQSHGASRPSRDRSALRRGARCERRAFARFAAQRAVTRGCATQRSRRAREFTIGNVRARGVELLCEPCAYPGRELPATPAVSVATVARAFVFIARDCRHGSAEPGSRARRRSGGRGGSGRLRPGGCRSRAFAARAVSRNGMSCVLSGRIGCPATGPQSGD